MRKVLFGSTMLLVILFACKQYQHKKQVDYLELYWDEKFAGKNPTRGNLSPGLAKVVDMLYEYNKSKTS